jgi:hypothetical protein
MPSGKNLDKPMRGGSDCSSFFFLGFFFFFFFFASPVGRQYVSERLAEHNADDQYLLRLVCRLKRRLQGHRPPQRGSPDHLVL